MRGRSCRADRLRGRARAATSRSVNSTASPDFAAQEAAGIAKLGSSAETIRTFGDGRPATSVANASMAAASLTGSPPEMRRARRSPGARAPSDLDRLRAARGRGAGRAEGVEGGRGGARQVPAVGEQDRGTQRPGHQRGGGDAGAPVVLVDERHGARPRAAGLRPDRRRSPARPRRRRGPRRPTLVVFLVASAGKPSTVCFGGLLLEPDLDRVVLVPAGGDRERQQRSGCESPPRAQMRTGARHRAAPLRDSAIERRTIAAGPAGPKRGLPAA